MQLPKPLFLRQGRQPYLRSHLVKDSVSGHLVRRAIDHVFTLAPSFGFTRSAIYETGEYSSRPSLRKADGMSALLSAFDAAAWRSDASFVASARWGIAGGSGRYHGSWDAYVSAHGFSKTFSGPYSCLTHITGISFTCHEYDYVASSGAGEARVALLVADTAADLPDSLASLQALPYVVIHGTGQYAFDNLHVASVGKIIFLISYIAGLSPPDSDGYAYDWDAWDYPNASFSIAEYYYDYWNPFYVLSVIVTYETQQDALLALEEEQGNE